MSAIASFNINEDDASTVVVTYDPVSIVGSLATWATAGNTSAGNKVITTLSSPRSSSRSSDKFTIKVSHPKEVLNSDTGVYSVTGTAIANLSITIPDTFTSSDREVLANTLHELLTDGIGPVHAMIHDNILVW